VSTQPEEDWDRYIEGLTRGQEDVLDDFYKAYGPTLQRVVCRRLNSGLQRRFDADDVVQSVLRTFFRRAQEGDLELEDQQRVWHLLCAISVTKMRDKIRFHNRMRRAMKKEQSANAGGGDTSGERMDFAASDPQPVDTVAFDEVFEGVFSSLEPDEQTVIQMKIQEHSNAEIAQTLKVSERTIRRMLERLQEKFREMLEHSVS
jgi:RNA polymerase sigma factor (sigma-70 family)